MSEYEELANDIHRAAQAVGLEGRACAHTSVDSVETITLSVDNHQSLARLIQALQLAEPTTKIKKPRKNI